MLTIKWQGVRGQWLEATNGLSCFDECSDHLSQFLTFLVQIFENIFFEIADFKTYLNLSA
jgi:hypothetical protein